MHYLSAVSRMKKARQIWQALNVDFVIAPHCLGSVHQ